MPATAPPNPPAAPADPQARRLTRKGARTHASILDAAERQFAVRGYDGVSLRQIIEEAGVQMGQLQYYFPSKEAVFTAVIDRRIGGVLSTYADAVAALERAADAAPVCLRQVIQAIMAGSRAFLIPDNPAGHRFLKILGHSTLSFNQPDYVALHLRAFLPLNEAVMRWLSRLFPKAREETVRSAYYFVETSLVSLYVTLDPLLARTGRERSSATVAQLHDDLEEFLLGGVQRMLSK